MASCPLGFGGPGAGKGELSTYHCVLCRGLLHDPVIVNGCRHVFCAFCIRRFRDCPVCGADIEGTSPEATLASAIGKILIGHANLISKATGPAAAPPGACPAAPGAKAASASSRRAASCPMTSTITSSPPNQQPDLDLPSVLLQLALQSLSGGNPEAALSRLDMCAGTLCNLAEASEPKTKSEAAGATGAGGDGDGADHSGQTGQGDDAGTAVAPSSGAAASSASASGGDGVGDPALLRQLAAARTSPDIASRLGAVLGCKADCHRRLGDADAAHQHYSSSLACLAPWQGRSREADSALSVTHNKLGDLLLLSTRLEEANKHYERALEIRRRVVAGSRAIVEVGAVEAGPPEAAEAEAGKAAQGTAAAVGAVEVAQDLCDLATSLCKVADMCIVLHDMQHRVRQGQRTGDAGAEDAAQLGGEEQGQQQEQQQAQQQGQQQQHERQPHPFTRARELLAEARRALLRREMMPYAHACGVAAGEVAPDNAVAGAAEAGASAAADAAAAALPPTDGVAGRVSSGWYDTKAKGGDSKASTRPGAGAAAESPLALPLVQRYGRVWGVLEQLTSRVQILQLASE